MLRRRYDYFIAISPECGTAEQNSAHEWLKMIGDAKVVLRSGVTRSSSSRG